MTALTADTLVRVTRRNLPGWARLRVTSPMAPANLLGLEFQWLGRLRWFGDAEFARVDGDGTRVKLRLDWLSGVRAPAGHPDGAASERRRAELTELRDAAQRVLDALDAIAREEARARRIGDEDQWSSVPVFQLDAAERGLETALARLGSGA